MGEASPRPPVDRTLSWKCDTCNTFMPNLKHDLKKIQDLVADMMNEIAMLKSIKLQKLEKKSAQDPVRRKIDGHKNLPNSTKVKKEMGVQTQELTENCKNKEAFDKASESDSTLTKTIKENYLLKRENKKLQERIAVLDNVIEEIPKKDKD